MKAKHKELAKDILEVLLGFTFVGNFISVGKFLRKWTKELITHAHN